MVRRVLSDAGIRHYAKRVFKDVQTKRQSGGKRMRKDKQNARRAKWAKLG